MSVLLKIVYINDIVVPCFAILCNILLLWLIKTVKTKTLLHINYSLVPNSLLDISVSIFGFIVAPHVFHIEGYLYFVFGDLFGSFINYDTACHIASIFGSLLMTSSISVTISFYVRYLVICRQRAITVRTIILPCIILMFVLIAFYVLLYWFYVSGIYYNPNADTRMLINFWVEEYGRSPIFVANKFAFGPFTIGIVPLLLVLLTFFLKLDSNKISLIISLSFVWLSITNPIAAFMIIKPHRNYIKTTMFKYIFKPFFQRRLGKTSKIIPRQNET